MEIVIRASVMYAFLFLVTRGLRRRALGDMAPFELLLLVTAGDVIQQGVTQEDYSLTGAVLAVATMALWISALTWASWRSERAARIIDGVPLVIVRDGEPIDHALAVEQLPLAEVYEAARLQGHASLDDVRLAILEVGGKISFIMRDDTIVERHHD